MPILAPGLTQHTVVLCVEKNERAVATQAILSKAGFKIITALTLYDALKFIAQEMPHLIITESTLTDGNAIVLFDRLQQNESLKRIPILVNVLKKTREEVMAVAKRKFAGFVLGKIEQENLLPKVHEVMTTHAAISPYFVSFENLSLESDATVSVEATLVGKSGDQIVSRSATEVDTAARLICVPKKNELAPVLFRMGTNLKTTDEIFNLFPLARAMGKGRSWLAKLPEISVSDQGIKEKAAGKKMRNVLYYDPNQSRFEGFYKVLKGYDFELEYAASLKHISNALTTAPERYLVVYLHELLQDASTIEFRNFYKRLSISVKPPLIVGTSSINAQSTTEVRYIKRPFGLGVFVEMLEAACERAASLSENVKKQNISFPGIPACYETPVKLVGVDETGGVLETRFPILSGSKVELNHPMLQKAWDGQRAVTIRVSRAVPKAPDLWQSRFDSVSAGMSKVKYWEKMATFLKTLRPDCFTNPTPEAEAPTPQP